MEDYLIDNKTGLVSDNNLNSFIDNIKHLMDKPSKRIQLGKAGRLQIKSLGSRESNMKRLVDLIGSF